MKPKKFKEATTELKKPSSMTDEECSSLFVHQSARGECISLWTVPFWQRVKFLFHGCVWVGILSGKTQPPIWLDMTETVFIQTDKPKFRTRLKNWFRSLFKTKPTVSIKNVKDSKININLD